MQFIPVIVSLLLLGPAKVNKVKIFSGPYYMIRRVLKFLSGVQESVLLDIISQNKVKTCQNCLHQKTLNKKEKYLDFF